MKLAKPLATILMAIGLINCAQFPKLSPHIIAFDKKEQKWKCGRFKVVSQENACQIQFSDEPEEWLPFEKCNGFYALPPSDITALKEYQAKMCTGEN